MLTIYHTWITPYLNKLYTSNWVTAKTHLKWLLVLQKHALVYLFFFRNTREHTILLFLKASCLPTGLTMSAGLSYKSRKLAHLYWPKFVKIIQIKKQTNFYHFIEHFSNLLKILFLVCIATYTNSPSKLYFSKGWWSAQTWWTGSSDFFLHPLESLYQGAGRRDLSHEQFTWSVLRNKLQGPKNSSKFEFVRIVAGTIKFGPCDLILWQKWVVHTMGLASTTCWRN